MSDEKSPLFSIIVPAYKLETLLPRCLDSLLAQTFSCWECVVVDDGSPDATGEVAEQYAAKDSRFTVIHKENGGVSSARNAGIEAAAAEYLLFLDGDDTLEAFALEWLAARLRETPEDLISFRMRALDEPAHTSGSACDCRVFCAGQQKAYMATDAASNVTNKVFRSDVLQNGPRFDPALARGEDQDFCFRYVPAFFSKFPNAVIRQFTVRLYVIHTDNGTGRASSQKVTAHAIDWDPEASRGYAARLMEEYTELVVSMGGWEGFAPEERLYAAHQYARRFAFAVWAARQLNETLPDGFWGSRGVGDLVSAMGRYKLYCAYYWPLRLHWNALIAAVYHSDESESKRLYWRVFLVGDLLLGRRWNRL